MRAGYVPGSGLLLGSRGRWLLATLPPAPGPVQQLWDALVAPPRVRCDDVADLATSLGAAAVVVVDLDQAGTPGATATRGGASADERGGDLLLGVPGARHDSGAELPLEGGAVAALSARVPVTRPAAAPRASAGPAPATSLIDGIPEAIRRPSPTGPSGPTDPPAPAPTPASPPPPPAPPAEGPTDTGGVTGEGPQHTRLRDQPLIADVRSVPPPPPAPPQAPAPPPPPPAGPSGPTGPPPPPPAYPHGRPADVDHDGHTSMVGAPTEPTDQLQHPTGETVQAVRCPVGHYTPTHVPLCRTCGAPVEPQPPSRVPRPPLGVLRLPDGQRLLLDRGVVLGRRPRPMPDDDPWPHLVRLPDEATHLSRLHLQIHLDGWIVLARDLGSRAGTTLRAPGRPPERIRPHESVILEDGYVVDLADGYQVAYTTSLDLG